jgi:hypothetical protein
VLRRIFGPKSDEVTWEWRRLHNEELYVMYCSPDITEVISKVCSTYVRENRCIQDFGVREGDLLKDPGVDGSILKWVLEK